MNRPAILLVDDDPVQLKLGRIRLLDVGFDVLSAGNCEEAFARVQAKVPDVIVSDVLMPDLDGFALCRRLREDPRLVHVPIILLSAHYKDAPDQQLADRVGAFALIARTPDFIDELATIRRALGARVAAPTASQSVVYEEHVRTTSMKLTQLLDKARSAEERYRVLFESARDAIAILAEDGTILECNERWHEVVGIPCQELVGRNIREFAAPGHVESNVEEFMRGASGQADRVRGVIQHRDGRLIYMEFSNTTLVLDGRRVVMTIAHDVTAMVEATRSLAAAEERLRSLVERLPEAVWTLRADTARFVYVTQNVLEVTGYSAEHHLADRMDVRLARVHPDDSVRVAVAFRAFVERGERFDIEYRSRRPDGTYRWLRNRGTARYLRDGVIHLDGMLSDVTEQKALEERFRQAQKMEAIGQLTGGIAHDFNNILGAILAGAEFLMEDLPEGDVRREDAVAIETAARRGAALTRQLLAFSRRQVLAPKVLTIDDTVKGLEKMLRRLLDENIHLTFDVRAHETPILVDESQLEQVIMNLVVNARDSMPGGGELTVETDSVLLDEVAGAQVDVPPGRYARLLVRDSGCGMDAETRRRLFEPFFTTKPLGQGTGLGLSTSYGIVKQSGGHFAVQSQVGVGTAMTVYFPCVDSARRAEPTLVSGSELRGTETVLVIEDDERMRTVVLRILAGRGYRVHSAMNAEEALTLARSLPRLDLVLADVILPDLTGPAVVRTLRTQHPGLRAIYMSGHTREVQLEKDDSHFIHKPFTHDAIARKLRDVLAAAAA